MWILTILTTILPWIFLKSEIENEIAKQESVLNKLHNRISVSDKDKQEPLLDELWALQRYITSLKRKVSFAVSVFPLFLQGFANQRIGQSCTVFFVVPELSVVYF